ncbi:uncharacterized protein METZ01_LOCUS437004, partial [marine metagenome]
SSALSNIHIIFNNSISTNIDILT